MSFRVFILLASLLLVGCADGPRDLNIGSEECAHCRMIVSEEAFAAQLRTQHGISHVFDSIECLADFAVQAGETGEPAIGGMWVTDFNSPGTWLDAEGAYYLRSPDLRSPMGMNLSAYASRNDVQASLDMHGGEILDWSDVRSLMQTAPSMGMGHAH